MNRVHTHVLVHTDPAHLGDTLASLAGQPVDVDVLPGLNRQVGFARALAFSLSEDHHDYLSFVDDGDIVMPGAYAEAVAYLDAHPDVVSVYSNVQRIHQDGSPSDIVTRVPWSPLRQLTHSGEVWHLHVMRRAPVMACLGELSRWPTCEEWVLMGLLTQWGTHHHVPRLWYRWRWSAGDSAGKQMIPALRLAAAKVVRPHLMKAHQRGLAQRA